MALDQRFGVLGEPANSAVELEYPLGQEPVSVITRIDDIGTTFRHYAARLRTAGRDIVGLKTEDPDVYSGQALADFTDDGSAMGRVRGIFQKDENEFYSGQRLLIVHTGVLGAVVGFVYGAVEATKGIRERFIKMHQQTIWERPMEATARLNDTLIFHGFRGGLKYGAKVGATAACYAAAVNIVQVARNKSGIVEYTLGGLIAGSLWRMNMGLSGMLTAGLLGATLGTIGGTLSYAVLRLSGNTYEEVLYWKKVQQYDRFHATKEAEKEKVKGDPADLPLRLHDVFSKAKLLNKTDPQELGKEFPHFLEKPVDIETKP